MAEPAASPITDEFVARMLRSLRRTDQLPHNVRRCFGGVIRSIEKRLVQERR